MVPAVANPPSALCSHHGQWGPSELRTLQWVLPPAQDARQPHRLSTPQRGSKATLVAAAKTRNTPSGAHFRTSGL
jgi:hypothetical protein